MLTPCLASNPAAHGLSGTPTTRAVRDRFKALRKRARGNQGSTATATAPTLPGAAPGHHGHDSSINNRPAASNVVGANGNTGTNNEAPSAPAYAERDPAVIVSTKKPKKTKADTATAEVTIKVEPGTEPTMSTPATSEPSSNNTSSSFTSTVEKPTPTTSPVVVSSNPNKRKRQSSASKPTKSKPAQADASFTDLSSEPEATFTSSDAEQTSDDAQLSDASGPFKKTRLSISRAAKTGAGGKYAQMDGAERSEDEHEGIADVGAAGAWAGAVSKRHARPRIYVGDDSDEDWAMDDGDEPAKKGRGRRLIYCHRTSMAKLKAVRAERFG